MAVSNYKVRTVGGCVPPVTCSKARTQYRLVCFSKAAPAWKIFRIVTSAALCGIAERCMQHRLACVNVAFPEVVGWAIASFCISHDPYDRKKKDR